MKNLNQLTKQSNHAKAMKKNLRNIFGTLLMTALLLTGCSKNEGIDNDGDCDPATASEFKDIREKALEKLTQNFQFDAADGNVTLTSDKGVKITINTNCLTLDGNAITGAIDLEFVEIYEKSNMLLTNKTTMGKMENGDKALLISGGEFFVNATQNGATLNTSCGFQLTVPADLTGGEDTDMILWDGNIDENGDLTWVPAGDKGGQGGLSVDGGKYYAFLQSFGWTNIDRFSSDPRPKTTILAKAPIGYDYTNSAVYLSYDGEKNGLAALDTFADGLFSEHYGQIPIGLECHAIFATEDNGNWKYAIKAVTIVEGGVIIFTEGETAIATEAQLTTIINGLP